MTDFTREEHLPTAMEREVGKEWVADIRQRVFKREEREKPELCPTCGRKMPKS